MKANQIYESLQAVNARLENLFVAIKEANTNDKQLDYTTHPSIANEVDRIEELTKRINKIVYQK